MTCIGKAGLAAVPKADALSLLTALTKPRLSALAEEVRRCRVGVGWLDKCGLQLGRHGLLVDEFPRPLDSQGDGISEVTEWPMQRYGRRVLVQHWGDALSRAQAAAAELLSQENVGHLSELELVGRASVGDQFLALDDPDGNAWLARIADVRPRSSAAVSRRREILRAKRLIEPAEADRSKLTGAVPGKDTSR